MFFPEYLISQKKINILSSIFYIIQFFLWLVTIIGLVHIFGNVIYHYLLFFYFFISSVIIIFYDLKTSMYRFNSNFTYLFSKNDKEYKNVLLVKAIDNKIVVILVILSPIFLALLAVNILLLEFNFIQLVQLSVIYISLNVIYMCLRIIIVFFSMKEGNLVFEKVIKIQKIYLIFSNICISIFLFYLPTLIFSHKKYIFEKSIQLLKMFKGYEEKNMDLAFTAFLIIVSLILIWYIDFSLKKLIDNNVYFENKKSFKNRHIKGFDFEKIKFMNIYFIKDLVLLFRDRKARFIELKSLTYFFSVILGVVFWVKNMVIFQHDEFVFAIGIILQSVIIGTLNLFIAKYFSINSNEKTIKWFVSTAKNPYTLIISKVKNQIILIFVLNELFLLFLCLQFQEFKFLFIFTVINLCSSIVNVSSNMITIIIVPSFVSTKEESKQNFKVAFFNSILSTIYEFIILVELSVIGALVYAGKMTSAELYLYVALTSVILALGYLLLLLLLSHRTSWKGWLNGY